MDDRLQPLFTDISKQVIAFSPSLFGGMAFLIAGWILGWLAKRITIQLALILKLERFLVRFSWGQVFFKADVRYGLYRFLGNVAFVVVFLVFLEFALSAWHLRILSDLLATAMLVLPRTFAAAIIFVGGWLVAFRSAKSLQAALSREKIPGSRLAGYFVRISLMVFFSAAAIIQLNIAGEIITTGFIVAFITLGVIAVIMVFFLAKELTGKARREDKGDDGKD